MRADTDSLLALLQLSDSSFPSGTFTNSFGLEELVAEGRIRMPADLETLVKSVVLLSIARADAVAAAEAVRCAAIADYSGIIEADQLLFSMKAASELRDASTSAGRRTIEELAIHTSAPALDWFLGAIRGGQTPGTHAVAIGVVADAFGATAEEIAGAVMFSAANVVFQAGMRLLPISHRDVQGSLHRLRPQIAACAEAAARPKRVHSMQSFHPVQEIAAMRHRFSEARLFAS